MSFMAQGKKVFMCLVVLVIIVQYLLQGGRGWNMRWLGSERSARIAPGPFPGPGGVDVTEGGQTAANDFLKCYEEG